MTEFGITNDPVKFIHFLNAESSIVVI